LIRRVLGQHFIKINKAISIIERIPLSPYLNVLEIGVGRGELTRYIAPKVRFVLGYEKDENLYKIALEKLKIFPNVKIVLGDALEANPTNFDLVIGNLPYSISRKFVEWMIVNNVRRAFVVLQKEFVKKLKSKPGHRKYGVYSVLTQYFYNFHILLVIPPSWFQPPPKVYSYLVEFRRKEKPLYVNGLIEEVRNLFIRKRKKLKSVIDKIWNEKMLEKRIYELEPDVVIEIAKKNLERKLYSR